MTLASNSKQTSESVLKSYDSTTESLIIATGEAEIRQFFSDLFAMLTDLSTLAAPVVDVTEAPTKQVFLVWLCPGSGVEFATDTFLYDSSFRIMRQVSHNRFSANLRLYNNSLAQKLKYNKEHCMDKHSHPIDAIHIANF
jgi:hypothetical protein